MIRLFIDAVFVFVIDDDDDDDDDGAARILPSIRRSRKDIKVVLSVSFFFPYLRFFEITERSPRILFIIYFWEAATRMTLTIHVDD